MNDRYLIISADAHAGLPCEEYRPYLDARYHGPFDEFLAHQTSDTFDHVATSDRNFYDRYYFNALDTNGDGVRQTTEPGQVGWTAQLLNYTGALVQQITTDAAGVYSFTGLTPGVQYQVQFSAPAGTRCPVRNTRGSASPLIEASEKVASSASRRDSNSMSSRVTALAR